MARLLLFALTFVVTVAYVAQGPVVVPAPVPDAGSTRAPASSRTAGTDTGDETAIERDASGQFHLSARVNGQEAPFLIDTGADTVAIGTDMAQRLGVEFDPGSLAPIARTASGTANGARVTIDRLEIAGQDFRDVEAVVIEGLDTNLLGQSLLRKLGRVELHGDRMVIRRTS